MSRLDELKRARPRSKVVRLSVFAFVLLTVYSWTSGDVDVGGLFTPRRMANLERFVGEATPVPLREGFDAGALASWTADILRERGTEATLATLGISVLAIVLAGFVSLLLGPLAASNVASSTPFEPARADERFGWRALRALARTLMILLRSVPEYVLAFLLLAMLGPGHAWPAVLALALHNGGILGRLGAETIENLDPGPLRTLRSIGAPRRAVLAGAVFPLALGRYLLYFFYRFETCVREATVLGILGVVSLGYWIQDARAKQYYDEMLFFVGLGAAIVLVADALSAIARRYVRQG